VDNLAEYWDDNQEESPYSEDLMKQKEQHFQDQINKIQLSDIETLKQQDKNTTRQLSVIMESESVPSRAESEIKKNYKVKSSKPQAHGSSPINVGDSPIVKDNFNLEQQQLDFEYELMRDFNATDPKSMSPDQKPGATPGYAVIEQSYLNKN